MLRWPTLSFPAKIARIGAITRITGSHQCRCGHRLGFERVAERDSKDFLVGVTLKIEFNLVGYVLLNKIYALKREPTPEMNPLKNLKLEASMHDCQHGIALCRSKLYPKNNLVEEGDIRALQILFQPRNPVITWKKNVNTDILHIYMKYVVEMVGGVLSRSMVWYFVSHSACSSPGQPFPLSCTLNPRNGAAG